MDADIGNIHTEIYPNVKENGNPPLYLLLHGLAMSSLMSPLKEIKEYLVENNYFVATLDFLGHGRSGGTYEDISLSSQVNQVKELLNYLREKYHFSSVNIIGHSYGGLVASLLTREEKVDSLVLLAPAFTLYQDVLTGNCLGHTLDFYDLDKTYEIFGMKLSGAFFKDILRSRINHSLDHYKGSLNVIISSDDEIIPKDRLIKSLNAFNLSYRFVCINNTDHEFKGKEHYAVSLVKEILAPLK